VKRRIRRKQSTLDEPSAQIRTEFQHKWFAWPSRYYGFAGVSASGTMDRRHSRGPHLQNCGFHSQCGKLERIKNALANRQLRVYEHHQPKSGNTIVGTWQMIGSPKHHEKFALLMVKDKDIEDFVY
jgi:hypothetical protein